MRRQIFLPMIHENPYFCFPESVGWYKEEPGHCAIRKRNSNILIFMLLLMEKDI